MTILDPGMTAQLAEILPPADFRRLIETFREDLGRLMAELEQSGQAGNTDGYRRAAHALAGAAAAVGAVLLERTARIAMDPRCGLPPTQMVPMIRAQAGLAIEELARLAGRAVDA